MLDTITTAFDCGKYYVEVQPDYINNDLIDFVLCKKGYGIKYHMFTLSKSKAPLKDWKKIIDKNIIKYIQIYNNIFGELVR